MLPSQGSDVSSNLTAATNLRIIVMVLKSLKVDNSGP